MSKRRRDGIVLNHKKRPIQDENDNNSRKRAREYEYWHHVEMSREERCKIFSAMYIHLLAKKL